MNYKERAVFYAEVMVGLNQLLLAKVKNYYDASFHYLYIKIIRVKASTIQV